jgi:hypothetical protein
MASKFKIATKTKFAYVASKTLVRHIKNGRHPELLRKKSLIIS